VLLDLLGAVLERVTGESWPSLIGKRVLDPKIIAAMSSPHADIPGSDGKYGYGLTLREFRGVRLVEHGGSRMGYGSSIRMAPEQRVAVVILANQSGASLPAMADKALQLMLPLKTQIPVVRGMTEVTASDLRKYPGVYRNGDSRIEVSAKDGKLWLRRGGSTSALTKLGEGRFALEGSGGSYVFVDGGYVHSGGRSFAK